MSRFARDCLIKMQSVVQRLEVALGSETSKLTMRFGLHSGPVTAGVLRGDKSRFQLFGDTVNTAARIETTGTKGKIHLSEATANLIVKQQKEHQQQQQQRQSCSSFSSSNDIWTVPRDEPVIAKGKGKMQTYWLEYKNTSAASSHYGGTTTASSVVSSRKQ